MSKRAMLIFLTCVLAFWCLAPAVAKANTTWTEIGDAGELLATAQDTGGGSLNAISGVISDPIGGVVDIDLYRIYIYNPSQFSASTVGSVIEDTRLWLFNASGYGIMGNDDAPGSWQSTLSSGSILQPTTAGWYYLAVSPWWSMPLDTDGYDMFQDKILAPDGNELYTPNSSLTLFSWNFSDDGYTGSYTITLSGASPTPIPGSVWLLASGLIGLAALRLRHKSLE